MDFPQKNFRCEFAHKDYTSDLTTAVRVFTESIRGRPLSSPESKFLPNIAAIASSNSALHIPVSAENGPFSVYKLNAPGFVYYQHWQDHWHPEGYLQILVFRSVPTSGNVVNVHSLLNTKDTTGKGNEHGNNMFPIRPGSNTYLIFRGHLADKVVNKNDGTGSLSRKELYFVPAYGVSGDENTIITKVGDLNSSSIRLPGQSGYFGSFATALTDLKLCFT